MINTVDFSTALDGIVNFYAGVPDSLLKNFCARLSNTKAQNEHIIAANEGNALALAAGHTIASGKPACVYMQNSGLGNIVNPFLSLMDKAVYRLPVLFIIGWRGEPGVKDEPQHVTQGELTLPLLECMRIPYRVMDADSDYTAILQEAQEALNQDKPFALVVRKGSFSSCKLETPLADISSLNREEAIGTILETLPEEYRFVSTTGKISRELYEHRDARGEVHNKDFLVVGSMGHTSQIALGALLARPDLPLCCLDGDGSVLMHMGSLAVNGSFQDLPLLHIMINNGSHDTVGGQPTVAGGVDWPALAQAAGYERCLSCDSRDSLQKVLNTVLDQKGGMTFVELRVAKGSRDDLGRPKVSALNCRLNFQEAL
ncbi:MAG: phosphonopyruvate decarboxylase [Spirochaetales bacterium]|nr:phosphonopyruvate decarboxylase [Spirochaetales bacterium]